MVIYINGHCNKIIKATNEKINTSEFRNDYIVKLMHHILIETLNKWSVGAANKKIQTQYGSSL